MSRSAHDVGGEPRPTPRGLQPVAVSNVRIVLAGDDDVLDGLVGFLRFRLDDALDVDCVALRVTRAGEIVFAWPEKPDSRGRKRTIVRPATDEARLAIEGAILEALLPQLPTIRRRVTEVRARAAAGGRSEAALHRGTTSTPAPDDSNSTFRSQFSEQRP